jgi:hypothetical protein
MHKSPTNSGAKQRILALDYLRGFFIIVIIVDHLWRWPNLFATISGRGELWASAAEGFVIISGLLVGYVRGYKNRKLPLLTVSRKLVSRGVMLYLWMIITSVALVSASWNLTFKGNMAYIPINPGDWNTLFTSILRTDYVHTLTHFLYLYAIFLVLSPLVIWLLRRSRPIVVALFSTLMWAWGYTHGIEWMQWQFLFFIPAIVGFYLDTLFEQYHMLSRTIRLVIRYGSIGIFFVTAAISASIILPTDPGTYQDTLFGRDPVTPATILISFTWFLGLLSLFQLILPFLRKWLGWLLLTFGERSLTAYILHTIPLVICQLLFAQSDNIWFNSLLAACSIVATWALLKIPYINRVIPR